MVILKELSNMFWGLVIESGKRYSRTVDKPFHMSMAALEVDLNAADKSGAVQVMLQKDSCDFLLCTLGAGLWPQQSLDLMFSSGELVEFFLVGKGVVHLSGSFVDEETDFPDDYASDEYDSDAPELVMEADDDDEEDEDWEPELAGSKRKAAPVKVRTGKRMKITEIDGDQDEDDDDDEYDSSFIDDETVEEEEEGEDEEEGDEESSMGGSPSKSPVLSQQAGTLDTSSAAESASKKKKKKKKQKAKEQKAEESQQTKAVGPSGEAVKGDDSGKKKKKKKKKNKQEDNADHQQTTVDQPPESPSPKASPAVGKKRTVAGGTCVEDLKVGHGPEAKPGKMVSVYYSGVLAKSNKRFDSCLKGKPFRFRLGRGEVIKGWDTGLIGMKVGGKRKITVPASQGYGNARQGPIPPGSTLVFDVEMKAVS